MRKEGKELKLSQPPLQIFGDNFANSYTPSPHDSKFIIDLLNALQHHLPLSFWQKVFVIFTLFPGPFSWKMAIFNFFSGLSFAPVIAIFIGGLILIAAIYLFKRFIFKRLVKKEPLTFLELVFPSMNDKTPYATEQLFAFLHALAKQRKFSHRILGHKKTYSLEIAATKEEGIRYVLGIPASESSIVEKSLLSYLPGMKMREIDDYLPKGFKDKNKSDNGSVGIIELGLSNDFVLPLKKHKALEEHDPIAYLTGNMTKLESDELMTFQILVTPLTRSSHGQALRHINKIEKLIYTNQPLSEELSSNPGQKALEIPVAVVRWSVLIFARIINGIAEMVRMVFAHLNDIDTKEIQRTVAQSIENRQQILNPYEQELQTEIKEKLDKPMFEVSLRLMVKSDTSAERDLRTSGFLASVGSLGSPFQTLIEKKSIWPFSKPPFFPFSNRELSSGNNAILSVSELTDIYHFPFIETTKTEDLVKSKSQPLPAPLSFKQSTTKFDNVFARNSYGGTETAIGQTPQERRRHTYILGATGSGKTTLLSTMIYNDIVNGKGVGVLDPHGQLIDTLLKVIPKNRIKDVIYFAPDDDGFPIALNLLELKNESLSSSQLEKQKSLVASSIISIFEKFYEAKYFGPRMEYVLRNAILTALETPEPTLQTVLDILTKKEYRKGIVNGLKNKVLKDFWVHEFEKLGSMQRNQVISPITNKIGGILSSPINYNILTQAKSKLNFDDVINSGKILLCDLSKGKIGEDESSFFGSLVIAKIQLGALRRALIPEEKRRDFNLYIDEFQSFATLAVAGLVSEARKYRIATVLAHQSISQIPDRDIVNVVLANVGTVICFKTANPEDEQFILPIFSPEVNKHEIANLPLYNFYMKISVGQAQDAFLAETENFTIKGSDTIAETVINQSRKQYATPQETLKKPLADSKELAGKRSTTVRKKIQTEPETEDILW